MVERLSDLQARVQKSRGRLEVLAARAAELQVRLRHDAALFDSLEKLNHAGSAVVMQGPAGQSGGNDGHLLSDAWEIALINEEGK